MADNTDLNPGSLGDKVVTREISHAGDTAKIQGVFAMGISGTEGAYTTAAINGDATNGLDVDVTRVGGTVTVDNGGTFAVQAAQSGSWSATVTNAGTFAVQVDGAALTALQLIDNIVLTEDAVHSSGAAGVMSLAVRNDVLAALGGTDGDYAPLQVDANGALYVNVAEFDNGFVDDAAFTPGTSQVSIIGATFDDVTPDSVDEGDGGAVRMSANRNLYATLRDAAGNERGLNIDANGAIAVTDGSGSLTVDNGGTFATQVDGAALTALQLIDNPIVAHDAAASGSTGVSMAGAIATNSVEGLTQVANADATRVTADLNGCLVTRPHTTLEEIIVERVSDTAGTSAAFTNFGAGGAGVHNYVTTLTVWNSSATDGYVDIRDGTAGTVLFTIPAPTLGGSVINLPVPLKQTTANTALAYDVSGALTTVYISAVGFQAQG